jgi:hypothetical protein
VGFLFQILGALLVLAAFALAQARVVATQGRVYLALNVIGATVLAVDAYAEKQWGFLLLEAVWALIAGWGLARVPRRGAARQLTKRRRTRRTPRTARPMWRSRPNRSGA